MAPEQELKHIVRIANTDLTGSKEIVIALKSIKGLSFSFNSAICKIGGIDPRKKTGYLTDAEIKKIVEILQNPESFNIPVWMLNKRKEYESGLDKHVIAVDWDLAKDEDIKRMRKIKCYRGVRHSLHAPVRGQRTRSNFRANKGKVVGVKKSRDAKSGRV
jgi:small subunit ribosomal protein S13